MFILERFQAIWWVQIIAVTTLYNEQTYVITKAFLFNYIENFTSKKNWKFSDDETESGSNDYPQSMFLSRNKKKIPVLLYKSEV